MNVKVASSYACRETYEEATFTFILLVEDVLKNYILNEILLVAISIQLKSSLHFPVKFVFVEQAMTLIRFREPFYLLREEIVFILMWAFLR